MASLKVIGSPVLFKAAVSDAIKSMSNLELLEEVMGLTDHNLRDDIDRIEHISYWNALRDRLYLCGFLKKEDIK